MAKRVLLACVASFALSTAAQADVFNFIFPIEGSQEVPPVPTPGSGVGNVTYDDVTNQLDWTITFQDLLGSTTNAHFHGPANPGQNAGIQVNIGAISGLNSPMIGSTNITEAQEAQLLDGLWYVNIHSNLFPGGEIRGQVVPEPATLALVFIAGAVALRRSRRRR